jgi:hypothetical protein
MMSVAIRPWIGEPNIAYSGDCTKSNRHSGTWNFALRRHFPTFAFAIRSACDNSRFAYELRRLKKNTYKRADGRRSALPS